MSKTQPIKIETEHHKYLSAMTFADNEDQYRVEAKFDVTDEDEFHIQINDGDAIREYYVSLRLFTETLKLLGVRT